MGGPGANDGGQDSFQSWAETHLQGDWECWGEKERPPPRGHEAHLRRTTICSRAAEAAAQLAMAPAETLQMFTQLGGGGQGAGKAAKGGHPNYVQM